MIAPDWLLYTLAFFCGGFFAAAILIVDLDDSNPADWRAINSTYGEFGFCPIDRINTMMSYPDHNKPINKPEPDMNTARQQFNTIQEARAFFAKARANRQTRHGYYQCADMLRARLNQHSRFVIGTEFMQ